MGEFAVSGSILIEIGVEEKDRNLVAVRTGMEIEPGPDPYRLSLYRDGNHRIERRTPLGRLPRVGLFDLAPLAVDALSEVARTADKRHEYGRQLEVGGGARCIACQYPEPAGIGVHLGPGRDLHREVGDARARKEGIEWRHQAGSYHLTVACRRAGRVQTARRRGVRRALYGQANGSPTPSAALVLAIDASPSGSRPVSARMASMVSGMTIAWLSTM